MPDPRSIARDSYRAYVETDRAAIEAMIGSGFHFTSPLDNRIDRESYFARCWPNSERITDFRLVRLIEDGEQVIVTYEGERDSGPRFRNTEVLTIRDGRIAEVEVYFGWNVPHEAPPGESLDAAGPTPAGAMGLTAIHAQLGCSDLSASMVWFEKLFGRGADSRPMDGLAEWHHGSGGLQLFETAEHAGHGTLTLTVEDLAGERERLDEAGLAPGAIEPATYVSLLRLRDPDHNLVVLTEPARA